MSSGWTIGIKENKVILSIKDNKGFTMTMELCAENSRQFVSLLQASIDLLKEEEKADE
jgi:hypothetical protein